MVAALGFVGLLLLIGGALLYLLGLLAARKGASSGRWRLGMLMAWAACWVLERQIARIWNPLPGAHEGAYGPPSLGWQHKALLILAATLAVCLLLYGGAVVYLAGRPDFSELEDAVDTIGTDPAE
jgi:hypothetical protein